MEKGQVVYLVPVNDNARYIEDNILNHVVEAKIDRVGKKYFYLEGRKFARKKFGIEEMRDISNYCSDWNVFVKHQDIVDELDRSRIISKIRSSVGDYCYSMCKLTISKLRKIEAIIDAK